VPIFSTPRSLAVFWQLTLPDLSRCIWVRRCSTTTYFSF